MRLSRSNARPTPDSARDFMCKTRSRLGAALLAVLLAAFLPAFSAKAQSASPKPTPAEPQPQTQSQPSPQPAAQSAPPAQSLQPVPGAKAETLADAARQNAQKAKPKPKHVYTDDDISNVGGRISVVGDASSSGNSADGAAANAGAQGNGAGSSGSNDETYWRGRADAIKSQIADVDRQIEDKKAEIAKAGPTSFDPSAGLSQGVIVIHDRNAELKDLEDRKQSLEDQLDQLADEGRKAGADSGWFR
ncbi:MAG: hypothetical protein WA581_14850 [Candidatus Acidiferrales bacterium]